MKRFVTRLLGACLATVVAAPLGGAQHLPTSSTAHLTTDVDVASGQAKLRVELTGASGPAFLWQVGPNPEGGAWWSVGASTLVGGIGSAAVAVDAEAWLAASPLQTRAVFLEGGVLVQSHLAPLEDVAEEPTGEPWDFDWGSGGLPQAGGAIVSQTQPWAGFATIHAVNADTEHPSEVVLFDSGNVGAFDPDLATPGGGLGNFEALGQLLVISADLEDADGDGLVDAPDAEDAGGTIVFDLAGPSTVFGLQIVDVDEPGGEVRWLREGVVVRSEALAPVGDNCVVTTGGAFAIDRVEVDLAGSAGIGGMSINPCETVIDFDTSPTGIPWGLAAGQLMSGPQAPEVFGGLLVFLTAENAAPGHPDEVVLFDTAQPTGGDDDLATPGPGLGNDAPLGKVLVLAEDDVDADGDLLVDDPDDEAQGGVITLAYYTSSGRFRGATVVDVDADEHAWVEVFLETGGSVVLPFESLGDNSVQSIEADVGPTRQVDFHLSGSAALAEVRLCPDPGS